MIIKKLRNKKIIQIKTTMSSKFSSYILTTTLVAMFITLVCAAPSTSSPQQPVNAIQKLTCLHQSEAKKKFWKTCPKVSNPTELPSYKYPDLDLIGKLSHNALPAMEIPPK